MLPGTDALRIKYQGSLPALLEQRTDLNADAIRTFVRRGTWSMPPFRPTEVTESDIQDIAAYLRQSSGAASRGAR
jgi:mono/diheme cytochrome c family protein